MNKQIKENTYVNICKWMMKMDLSAKELLLYALIYSFSMDGVNSYYGSASYLANWVSAGSRKTVFRCMKSLEEKGYIKRSSLKLPKTQKMTLYQVTEPKGDPKLFDCVTIYPFMINDLHLKDRQLILYALIYGFSKKGSDTWCTASLEYFAEWLDLNPTESTFNHIRDRYLTPMKNKKLIEVGKSGLIAKYKALVPEETGESLPPQIDTTIEEDGSAPSPQNDTTNSQIDTTSHPKMTLNNLEDILVNDKSTINNNYTNTKESNILFTNKEALSVVVSKDILDNMDFSIDYSAKAWNYRLDRDFTLYEKYKTSRFNLAEFMSGYALAAQVDLELFFCDSDAEGMTFYEKGSNLLLKIVTNKRFAGKEDIILSLDKEKITQMYNIASRLFSKDEVQKIKYTKTRESYLIGVIENILDQN